MKKSYSDKLRDPRWQKKRLEIMQRDGFKCRACKSETETLNVHHVVYQKGCEPWEYHESILVTMCEECHDDLHKLLGDLSMVFVELGHAQGSSLFNSVFRGLHGLLSVSDPVTAISVLNEAVAVEKTWEIFRLLQPTGAQLRVACFEGIQHVIAKNS